MIFFDSIFKWIFSFMIKIKIIKNILNGWTGDPTEAYNDVYYTSGEHKITVGYFYLSSTSIFEALSEGWTVRSGRPEAVRKQVWKSGSGPEVGPEAVSNESRKNANCCISMNIAILKFLRNFVSQFRWDLSMVIVTAPAMQV